MLYPAIRILMQMILHSFLVSTDGKYPGPSWIDKAYGRRMILGRSAEHK